MQLEEIFKQMNEAQRMLIWNVLMDIVSSEGSPEKMNRLNAQIKRYNYSIEQCRDRQRRYKKIIDDAQMVIEKLVDQEGSKELVELLEDRQNDYRALIQAEEPFESLAKVKRVRHIIEKLQRRTKQANQILSVFVKVQKELEKGLVPQRTGGFMLSQLVDSETLKKMEKSNANS